MQKLPRLRQIVAQRTREFGIRLALGATRREIVSVVLRHGGRLILIGAAIGLAGSLGLSKLLDGLLYGVTPVDMSSALAVSTAGSVGAAGGSILGLCLEFSLPTGLAQASYQGTSTTPLTFTVSGSS